MVRAALILTTAAVLAGATPAIHTGSPHTTPTALSGAWTSDPARDSVPAAVRDAVEAGRYWRASRLLEGYLATVSDTAPEHVLLAARLNAGWGGWGRVDELLEGRPWLDSLEAGAAWELLGRSRIERGRPAAGARAFARYLELHPTTDRERAVAQLRRARGLALADSTRAALAAFAEAADLLPWFRDWTAMLAVEAAVAGGDTAAVRDWLREAGSLAAGREWRLRMRGAREAGDTMSAREIALATARSAGSRVVRSEGWAELGAMRLAAGDTARARRAFAAAIEVPGSVGAVTGARLLTELGPTTEQWRRIGDIYTRHGNPTRAADAYREYLEAGGGTVDERERIRLAMGTALYRAGRFGAAEETLQTLADDAGSARVGAQALYLAGRAQYRQGRSAEGQATLARLPERYPGQPAVTRGLYLLADLKHDELAVDEARSWYRQAAEASPDLNEAGLALMRLGGLALLEEDYEGAVDVFERYRTLHPTGRRWDQATYWAARAYAALDRQDEARARLRALRSRDPVSYYGMRAAELLGEPFLTGLAGTPPRAPSGVDARLRRVDLLAELGLRPELVREVERVRARVADDRAEAYALAEALNERGYTLTAISMGWDLYRSEGAFNERLLRIIYPFPFRDLVLPEARALGLDPYLVAGLIRRESAFNPTVTSSAGAIGLMQIMPETGRALAREVGLDRFEVTLLEQPEVNLHLGTLYLATMLERYGHSLPLVLSAYNAGPTRAAVWREFPEAREEELFTERVPFRETRDYIRNVLLHRTLYRQLYPDLDARP